MNMNPMSPLEESKLSMCLSPQDKLKGNSSALSLAQRKKAHEMDLAVVKKEVMDADMDSGWISDDNLRAMDFDESLNQDIDWVVHDDDDLGMSLTMDFAHDSDHDVVNDFGFGPSSFLSPLRGEMLTFEDSSEVSSSFVSDRVWVPSLSLLLSTPECMNMELPGRHTKDAEKLLMSFDTMNFTIPSPTSSSSKKKRTSLFAKKEQAKGAATTASRSSVASKGSMSPSLKLKVSARALSPDELQDEQARAAPSKPTLTGVSSDPFLGVLNITAPSSEQLLFGSENTKKIGSYSPAARKLRIQKFHEKRKNRTWKKSIKYDCRKKLADDRPRIKGRFVRVLENMCDMKDDEPMSPSGEMSPLSISSFTSPVTPVSSPEPVSLATPATLVVVMPAVPSPDATPASVAPVNALSASTAAIASLVASTS